MTVAVAERHPQTPQTPRAWRATEAISALGTRMSFVAAAWLVLAQSPNLAWLGLVVGVQALAYLLAGPAAVWLLHRLDHPRMSFGVDLASAVVVTVMAVVTTNLAAFTVLAGVVGALRAVSDLAKNLLSAAASRVVATDAEPGVPAREWLIRPLVLAAGAVLGVAAAALGPPGVLWLVALTFAVAAALVVLATSPAPAVAADFVPVEPGDGLAGLRRGPFARRLAGVLLLTSLFGQAATVAVVPAWVHGVLSTDRSLGTLGGACIVGAVAGSVVFTALALPLLRYVLLAVGYLAGAGTIAILQGMRPAGLLVVAAAFLAGLATASVTPVLGGLLSLRIPAALRPRVAALAAMVTCIGVAAGGLAGGWIVAHTSVRPAIALAGGCYLVAMLTPVFGYRTWQQLGRDAAPVPSAAPKLSARLSVTLAYADGQWLVEVRKGRALLGTRHPVKPAQALTTLSTLDVPGLRGQVEQVVATDQTEASRHVDRMRSELTELEAKLAGLQEMMDLSAEEPPVDDRDGH